MHVQNVPRLWGPKTEAEVTETGLGQGLGLNERSVNLSYQPRTGLIAARRIDLSLVLSTISAVTML